MSDRIFYGDKTEQKLVFLSYYKLINTLTLRNLNFEQKACDDRMIQSSVNTEVNTYYTVVLT